MKFKEWYFHIVAIAFCGSFLSSMAFADSINFAGSYQENGNGTVSDAFAVKYIKDINKQVDVDVLYQGSKNRTSDTKVNQFETGIRYKKPIAKKTVCYVKTLVGSLQIENLPSRNYAGAEFGIMTKPFKKIGFRADHTIHSGLNTDSMDNNFSKLWISYDLSDKDTVAIRKDIMRGDIKFDTWRLIYQYKF